MKQVKSCPFFISTAEEVTIKMIGKALFHVIKLQCQTSMLVDTAVHNARSIRWMKEEGCAPLFETLAAVLYCEVKM